MPLTGVVKDHAHRIAHARGNRTYPVAHIHAMKSSRSGRRTIAVGEDYSLALVECDRFAARLRPRPLLDQQEFAPFEIAPAPAECASELERKCKLAIQILMKAVVAACLIAKDQRRGPGFVPAPSRS